MFYSLGKNIKKLVLINNAGIASMNHITLQIKTVRRILDTNVLVHSFFVRSVN